MKNKKSTGICGSFHERGFLEFSVVIFLRIFLYKLECNSRDISDFKGERNLI